MIPNTNIVIEKQRIVAATIVPNPANGTPKAIQTKASRNIDRKEIKLSITPKTEIHAKGRVLYAKIL
jgi:hypothetical protein